jgi:hypothetical protein
MSPFFAMLLICLNTAAPEACDERTAADVLSTGVESEFSCVTGWQEVAACSGSPERRGRSG